MQFKAQTFKVVPPSIDGRMLFVVIVVTILLVEKKLFGLEPH